MKGRFIVIEGLDGSGKSTQTALLKQAVEVQGKSCEFIHFPRTNDESKLYGPMLKRFLKGELGALDEVDPYFVALLFAGDRKNAAQWINDQLDAGKWVIADRYVLSNIAFQGAKLSGKDRKRKLADWVLDLEFDHFELPIPDLTLFLHMPFSFTEANLTKQREGEDRDYLDGESDIHEADLQFQKDVYAMYKMMLEMPTAALTELEIEEKNGQIPSPEYIHTRIMSLIP